jgi:hypothetical protein
MKGKLLLVMILIASTSALQDSCTKQADCRALSECDAKKCIHKPLWELAPSEYVGTFIIFILCALGAGTGPLMTPIFILIWFFSAFDAIPLSQVVIFSASVVSMFFRVQERDLHCNRPMIAWDLLILLQPPLICGTLFGVILNFTFPEW